MDKIVNYFSDLYVKENKAMNEANMGNLKSRYAKAKAHAKKNMSKMSKEDQNEAKKFMRFAEEGLSTGDKYRAEGAIERLENLTTGIYESREYMLSEKAKSEIQQQAAGAALAVKRGEADKSTLRGASLRMYNDMTEKELEDFARTKHDTVPHEVPESNDVYESIRQRMSYIAGIEGSKFPVTEASYSTQDDYYNAQDIRRAREAAEKIIQDKLGEIEYETSNDPDIPSKINVLTIVEKNLNYKKLWKDLEAAITKAYK